MTIARFSVGVPALVGLLACGHACAQTVWSGYDFSFTKPSFADWTDPANQDRITSSVWLTRANVQGLFNIHDEDFYMRDISPSGTEWSFGVASDWESLDFHPWEIAVGTAPPLSVDQAMVVHLIEDDIYLDIMFTRWGIGPTGGSFAYVRAVPAPGTLGLMVPLGVGAFRRRRR